MPEAPLIPSSEEKPLNGEKPIEEIKDATAASPEVAGFKARVRQFAKITAFVFLSSMIMVMASERVYWYWAANPNEFCFDVFSWWGLGLWYCLPTVAGLWALGWGQATRWYQVVLAASLYAYITEGVITPVMYEGGPFDPFMPAMFLGWHGMFAMFGFWYLTRWLIVKRSRRMLSVAAVIAGLIWGIWATTSWLPESLPDAEAIIEDNMSAAILTPEAFTLYAATVGVVFAVSHWLLGHVWPADFRPGKRSTVLIIAMNALLFLPMVMAIPWAPLKFGFFVGLSLCALKRSRRNNSGPTIFTQLAGPTTWIDIAPVMLMPIVAAALYAGITAGNPSEETVRTFAYYGFIWGQVIAGAVALIWALTLSFRRTPSR